MNGRIGALAIRRARPDSSSGGAQGGIWTSTPQPAPGHQRPDDLGSLAIGALAVAPSDDTIVYAGTGEGALSGDSYYGNGILKSTDGGVTWTQVSGDYFQGVSMSRIVVDPRDAEPPVRGGASRPWRRPPGLAARHSRFGIWESKDGGDNWTLLKRSPRRHRRHRSRDRPAEPEQPVCVASGATPSTRAPTAATSGRRS